MCSSAAGATSRQGASRPPAQATFCEVVEERRLRRRSSLLRADVRRVLLYRDAPTVAALQRCLTTYFSTLLVIPENGSQASHDRCRYVLATVERGKHVHEFAAVENHSASGDVAGGSSDGRRRIALRRRCFARKRQRQRRTPNEKESSLETIVVTGSGDNRRASRNSMPVTTFHGQ